MKKIEEFLFKEKEDLDNVKVPKELEDRLRTALKDTSVTKENRTHKSHKGIIAAAIILTLFVGYSYDAIAYYGKKIIGYDNIVTGSLKELNDIGRGQEINKEYTFSDGTKVSFQGIMFDENELNVFYTVSNENGNLEDSGYDIRVAIKGVFGEYIMRSGSGIINDEKTEIKYVGTFESPNIFEKRLSFNLSRWEDKSFEQGSVRFTLNRNKAIKKSVKQNIDKVIEIDGIKVKFNSIVASPMSTFIKGQILNFNDLGKEEPNSRYDVRFNLIVNDKKIQWVGGSMGRNISGVHFERRFDGINNVNKLEINDIELVNTKDVDTSIEIPIDSRNYPINIEDTLVTVEKVYVENEKTYIIVKHDKDINLLGGYFIDDKDIKQNLINTHIEKSNDGKEELVKDTWELEGIGSKINLLVKGVEYKKGIGKNISIPVK